MNVLEELWYGNIEPAEYDISSSKEYKEILQLISRNEDKLLATMTDTQKELFTKYSDCVREYLNTPGRSRQVDRASPTPIPLKSYTLSAAPTPPV